MNRKGQLTLGLIIMIFIIAIVGLALLQPIFNNQNILTSKRAIVNEAIDISDAWLNSTDMNSTYPLTIAQAPSGWKVDRCPIESVTFGNSTDDYTVTTDYTFTASTGVLLLSTNGTDEVKQGGNDTLIDYTYCPDGYNPDGGSRGVAGIIGLFVALALVLAIVGLGIKEWMNR